MLNVKVKDAAALMQKSEQFIRIGLQRKFLPFGTAIKAKGRFNYHISAAKFCDYMGLSPEDLVSFVHGRKKGAGGDGKV